MSATPNGDVRGADTAGLFSTVIRNFRRGRQRLVPAAVGNRAHFATGLSTWSTSAMSRLARAVFGHCEWPMRSCLDHSPGGFAALSRKMPLRSFWDYISREFLYSFMLTRKPG